MVGLRGFESQQDYSMVSTKPTFQSWTDASMSGGSGKTNSGSPFQCIWSEQEARKHIKQLELRAPLYAFIDLESSRYVVQLHLDNIKAITFIRRLGGTHSLSLCKESHLLWSYQVKHHYSPPSVAIHIGEHRGGLPQQTQTAQVGLQTNPIRVLEDLPETSSLAHT